MHEIFWYVEREYIKKSFEAFDLIKQMFNECWILKIDSCWDKITCVDMNGSVSIGDKGWKFPQLNFLSCYYCVYFWGPFLVCEKGWEIFGKLIWSCKVL